MATTYYQGFYYQASVEPLVRTEPWERATDHEPVSTVTDTTLSFVFQCQGLPLAWHEARQAALTPGLPGSQARAGHDHGQLGLVTSGTTGRETCHKAEQCWSVKEYGV